jgi:hypothetical protein
MVNLFPEQTSEGGKTAGFLSRCPGLRLLATLGVGPIRGMWVYGGYAYVVSGNSLYKLTTLFASTLLGTVTGTGPVSMTDNGTMLFIAANPDAFTYYSDTGIFAKVTDGNFAGAKTVAFIDGYIVYNPPNTQLLYSVNTIAIGGGAIDPLVYDLLNVAAAEGSPDLIQAIIPDHREIWVLGTNSVEVWYNAGTANFPFARIQGAFNELGCSAAYSVAKLDNTLFWLGSDARGKGIVYKAQGYSGLRISTHAVEFAIQNYANISDAVAYTYQQEGHSFYVLSFPSANTTWVYDVSVNGWHERAGFVNGEFTRHRSQFQMAFANEVVVGDYENGNIYAFDLDVYADYTNVQRFVRSWRALPTGQNNLNRTAHHSLQVDIESGVGLDGITQGTNPQVLLRWSDDGGHTWSNYYQGAIGPIGQFGNRVIWRRLGMTMRLRDRVYEISGSDPVKIAIMGAKLNINATDA